MGKGVPRDIRAGGKMPDDTVYAGISPETGTAMYTTPEDAPTLHRPLYTLKNAMEYASKLDAYGHNDWRVPTRSELRVLFKNRAAIGGFHRREDSGQYYPSWCYWSLTPATGFFDMGGSSCQEFDHGKVISIPNGNHECVRCIRTDPTPANKVEKPVNKGVYQIGDVLPDGWTVGPASPHTGKPVAIEPACNALDGYQTWYDGQRWAEILRKQGNLNARQPSARELNAIFNDVVKAGRNGNALLNDREYNGSVGSRYWSSTPSFLFSAKIYAFFDGEKGSLSKSYTSANVRCIRDEPEITLQESRHQTGHATTPQQQPPPDSWIMKP